MNSLRLRSNNPFAGFPHPENPDRYYPSEHSNYPQRGEVARVRR